MAVDKSLKSFIAMINAILKPNKANLKMDISRERCLEYPTTEASYDAEFPPVDLADLQSGDKLYIHYFLTVEGITNEGYCVALVDNNQKIEKEFVNLDSVHPPMEIKTQTDWEKYKIHEKFVKKLMGAIMNSLNEYLKS